MALNKNNTTSAQFENVDDDAVESAPVSAKERLQAAADARAAEQAAAAAPATTAVATAKPQGGQVAKPTAMINPLEPLKNAFFCEFDTLRGLKVTNGNVVDIQSGKQLGDVVGMELLSYQDQWVISPGVEGDEGKELVRYSDDGVTTSKGDNVKEYLESLKSASYPGAKLTARTVIAGSLFDIGEKGRKTLPDMQDSLVQMSLAPTSKAAFDRYTMDQAFRIGKGVISAEGATMLKLECVPASKNGKDWTICNFSRWA